MTITTQDKNATTAASFAQLKVNATGPEDIKNWFKKNLHIVPKLPAELYDCVLVDINYAGEKFDFIRNTIDVSFRMDFCIKHQINQSACSLFEEITGVEITEDHPSSTYLQTRYEIKLDAREWRFIAYETLRSLTPEILDRPSRKPVYRNILETHFPHFKWPTFMDLFNADLLPKNLDAFAQIMKGTETGISTLSIPEDLSP